MWLTVVILFRLVVTAAHEACAVADLVTCEVHCVRTDGYACETSVSLGPECVESHAEDVDGGELAPAACHYSALCVVSEDHSCEYVFCSCVEGSVCPGEWTCVIWWASVSEWWRRGYGLVLLSSVPAVCCLLILRVR